MTRKIQKNDGKILKKFETWEKGVYLRDWSYEDSFELLRKERRGLSSKFGSIKFWQKELGIRKIL